MLSPTALTTRIRSYHTYSNFQKINHVKALSPTPENPVFHCSFHHPRCPKDDDTITVISGDRPFHPPASGHNFERLPRRTSPCCGHICLCPSLPSLPTCCCCPKSRKSSTRNSAGVAIGTVPPLESWLPACPAAARRPPCRRRGKVSLN